MILPYIINVALVLGACIAFYKVLLKRETFYRVNRFVLMGCLVLAFGLPMITVPEKFSLRNAVNEPAKEENIPVTSTQNLSDLKLHTYSNEYLAALLQGKPTTGNRQLRSVNNLIDFKVKSAIQSTFLTEQLVTGNLQPNHANHKPQTINHKLSFGQILNWMMFIYWFGVIIFGASFLFQLSFLLFRSWRNPVIIDGRYRIVELSGDHAPCSFGNTIFINPSKYDWETFNQILLHEKIHISQRHTLDIILAELVLVFQWFNPFAWIYRREIENNLEYLTDDQLVKEPTINKKSYQLSLLKVSAPHIPLSLTTNYNQSTLKKRIAMMNSKRSSVRTTWKYFFLLPVLILLVCILNEPLVKAQGPGDKAQERNKEQGTSSVTPAPQIPAPGTQTPDIQTPDIPTPVTSDIDNKGYWFAVIKNDQVSISFSDEKMENDEFKLGKGHSFNGNTFTLAELGTLPRGTEGKFFITREAGKLEMTGKFDGNTGMGTYEFFADKSYFDHMEKELKGDAIDEHEQLAFFFLNVKKDYVRMLKSQGFNDLEKDEVIPAVALGIDAAFVKMIRENGYKDAKLEDLVPIKALGIDAAYIKEIKESGLKNVDLDKLVAFKAQGIDKAYIQKMKLRDDKDFDDDGDDLVSWKAMGIDDAYIKSWKDAGIDVPTDQLVAFKAMGITPAYIKSWKDAGYKDIDVEDYVGLKSQNVTPEFMKSFTDMGYKNVDPEEMVAFRALGITPEYVKSFEAAGYKNIDLDEFPGLKSQGVTPELIKTFEALGFKNIDVADMVGAKAMGVTPEYIKEMRAKGLNYDKLEKYIRLKSID